MFNFESGIIKKNMGIQKKKNSLSVMKVASQNLFNDVHWVDLIVKKEEEEQFDYDIYPNMVHVVPCIYPGPISHIRIQPIPGN